MRQPPSSWKPSLWLTAWAFLALMPSIVYGMHYTHSAVFNVVWTDLFAQMVQQGQWYPRWLDKGFAGLGSPSFYFYAPLPFWIDALVSLLTLDLIPHLHRFGVSAAVILASSGIAMWFWLKDQVCPKSAFWGAWLYMLAPYHLGDYYLRGAFGEYSIYMTLPVLALGLLKISQNKPSGLLLSALGYAFSIYAHLPSALLLSVFFIPFYTLYLGAFQQKLSLRFFLKATTSLVLGLGLSAMYALPAITLQPYISTENLWSAYFNIWNSFFLFPSLWREFLFMLHLALLWGGTLILSFVSIRAMKGSSFNASGYFWLGLLWWSALWMSGLTGYLWEWLPVLHKVQFSWRLLPLFEFSAATAVAFTFSTWASSRYRLIKIFGAVPLLASIALFALLLSGSMYSTHQSFEEFYGKLRQYSPDAAEYYPAGYRRFATLEDSRTVPLAKSEETTLNAVQNGSHIRIELHNNTPQTIIFGRFMFPIWQVLHHETQTVLPVYAATPQQLVAFTAPAGGGTFELQRISAPTERLGYAISLSSALLLMLGYLVFRKRNR